MENQKAATLGANVGALNELAENLMGQIDTDGFEEKERLYTQKELDSEADRRATKAAETAVRNFVENELPKRIERERTEAEKLAKMSAEEKADHERKQLEQELEQKSAEITRRELRIGAMEILAKKGVPMEFEALLNYSDAESCNASIEAIEKVYFPSLKKGIEEGVNLRLRGKAPGEGDSCPSLTYKAKIQTAKEKGDVSAVIALKREAAAKGEIVN